MLYTLAVASFGSLHKYRVF